MRTTPADLRAYQRATQARRDAALAEQNERDDREERAVSAPASTWPYRLADPSLYRHRAFGLLPDDDDHPIDQAAIEQARENAIDALDSSDPVNALADYGWESDAYLQPADGEPGGHLDTLLIHLISDVRRLREQGRENEAQHEAYRRVLSLADRIAEHHAASISGQRVALDQLAERWINSCMDVAGV